MAITLTEVAAARVRGFLEKNADAIGLRVGITTTGCSGYAYVVDFAKGKNDDDQIYESHGIQVLVSNESLGYLDGTEVDYGKEGLNEGFKFNNPNAKSTCGCGESFSL